MLSVVEVDEAGDAVRRVIFEADDLDGAYDELDARFVAGEGRPQRGSPAGIAYQACVRRRDWQTIAAGVPTRRRAPRSSSCSVGVGSRSDQYVDSLRASRRSRPGRPLGLHARPRDRRPPIDPCTSRGSRRATATCSRSRRSIVSPFDADGRDSAAPTPTPSTRSTRRGRALPRTRCSGPRENAATRRLRRSLAPMGGGGLGRPRRRVPSTDAPGGPALGRQPRRRGPRLFESLRALFEAPLETRG